MKLRCLNFSDDGFENHDSLNQTMSKESNDVKKFCDNLIDKFKSRNRIFVTE